LAEDLDAEEAGESSDDATEEKSDEAE